MGGLDPTIPGAGIIGATGGPDCKILYSGCLPTGWPSEKIDIGFTSKLLLIPLAGKAFAGEFTITPVGFQALPLF